VVDTGDEEPETPENTAIASRRGARIRRQPDRFDTAYAITIGFTRPE
jgi:hypothetical protein